MNPEPGKKQHGGPRTPGPGKTLGRPKGSGTGRTRVTASFNCRPQDPRIMDAWAEQYGRRSRGEVLSVLVDWMEAHPATRDKILKK